MNNDPIVEAIQLYREALTATENLYLKAAQEIREQTPTTIDPAVPESSNVATADSMQDLHNGLVMKVYAAVAGGGAISLEQRQLGRILLTHLWKEPVMGSKLREAIDWLIKSADTFEWYALVQPFLTIPVLRDDYGTMMSLVMRMGNLVARSDGGYTTDETRTLEALQAMLDQFAVDATPQRSGGDALQWLRDEAARLRSGAAVTTSSTKTTQTTPTQTGGGKIATQTPTVETKTAEPQVDPRTPEERLADAMRKLNQLIGLDNIKEQVRTLTNFLKMEKLRIDQGLPTTQPSLHMSFVGNPGTGKTTVARIIAEIYGALGVLQKGHLVETDRSGLVAEYAGQTGPKTNAKIDEALDGVLFIDEAYTLIDGGQDQYGREAIQTLLKRMEDQRERLVVILAGYPVEMETMIRSNPGLGSRVGTTMEFEDYTPGELARIFGLMSDKAKYQMPTDSRRRVLYGLRYLYQRRDRHFGNGRTSRNSFERSVRKLANRLASVEEVTRELLTTLEPIDIEIAGIDQAHLAAMVAQPGQVQTECDQCRQAVTVSDDELATEIACPQCEQPFTPYWGEPVDPEAVKPEPESSRKRV